MIEEKAAVIIKHAGTLVQEATSNGLQSGIAKMIGDMPFAYLIQPKLMQWFSLNTAIAIDEGTSVLGAAQFPFELCKLLVQLIILYRIMRLVFRKLEDRGVLPRLFPAGEQLTGAALSGFIDQAEKIMKSPWYIFFSVTAELIALVVTDLIVDFLAAAALSGLLAISQEGTRIFLCYFALLLLIEIYCLFFYMRNGFKSISLLGVLMKILLFNLLPESVGMFGTNAILIAVILFFLNEQMLNFVIALFVLAVWLVIVDLVENFLQTKAAMLMSYANALFVKHSPLERALWTLQSALSLMLMYCFVCVSLVEDQTFAPAVQMIPYIKEFVTQRGSARVLYLDFMQLLPQLPLLLPATLFVSILQSGSSRFNLGILADSFLWNLIQGVIFLFAICFYMLLAYLNVKYAYVITLIEVQICIIYGILLFMNPWFVINGIFQIIGIFMFLTYAPLTMIFPNMVFVTLAVVAACFIVRLVRSLII